MSVRRFNAESFIIRHVLNERLRLGASHRPMRFPVPFNLRGALSYGLLLPTLLLFGGGVRALAPAGDLGQLSRRAWQTETGLPQNTVHSVAQTRDGYVWVATEEGVAR